MILLLFRGVFLLFYVSRLIFEIVLVSIVGIFPLSSPYSLQKKFGQLKFDY